MGGPLKDFELRSDRVCYRFREITVWRKVWSEVQLDKEVAHRLDGGDGGWQQREDRGMGRRR